MASASESSVTRRAESRSAVAIVRPPADTLGQCQLTHLDRVPIDVGRARAEHAHYCHVLAQAGFELVELAADRRFPDGVFVEDTAVVLDEMAIMCRPGARSRRGELTSVADALAAHRPLRHCPPSCGRPPDTQSPSRQAPNRQAPNRQPPNRQPRPTMDGGDVLRVGRTLFVGLTTRTNDAAARWLEQVVTPLGYRVVGLPVAGALHLKTAVTALDDETVVLNPAWVDRAKLGDLRVVTIDSAEPAAANVLVLGDRLVMNAACPSTIAKVEALGFAVLPHELTELAKAEAGLTCSSLLIDQS